MINNPRLHKLFIDLILAIKNDDLETTQIIINTLKNDFTEEQQYDLTQQIDHELIRNVFANEAGYYAVTALPFDTSYKKEFLWEIKIRQVYNAPYVKQQEIINEIISTDVATLSLNQVAVVIKLLVNLGEYTTLELFRDNLNQIIQTGD